MNAVLRDLAALWAYGRHYLAAQSDAVKARVRRTLVLAALGLAAMAVALAVLIAAVVLALTGIAGGLGACLASDWAGQLLTGLGLLLLMGLGGWAGLRYWNRLALLQAKERYERRRETERRTVGADAAGRAAGDGQ